MIGTHCAITNDLYEIGCRVKEIDSSYFIVRNYKFGRFELHSKEQRGGTLALVLPFDRLDARTLTLARSSRAERAATLVKEAEEHNRRHEKEETERILRETRRELL